MPAGQLQAVPLKTAPPAAQAQVPAPGSVPVALVPGGQAAHCEASAAPAGPVWPAGQAVQLVAEELLL